MQVANKTEWPGRDECLGVFPLLSVLNGARVGGMTQPAREKEQEPNDEEEFDEDDLENVPEVQSECRCGECCRHLIIEAGLEDAEREPRIKTRGSPVFAQAEFTKSGKKELEGYLLNAKDNDNACAFLEQTTNLCSIYETRPWACRVFDCDGEGREQLIQLGIRPGNSRDR